MNADAPLSAYIVHSRLTSLAGRPFAATQFVRPSFRSIMGSRLCFSDFLERSATTSNHGVPFIKNLGEIGLSDNVWNLLGGRDFSTKAPYLFFPERPWWEPDYYSREEWRNDARYLSANGCLGYVPRAEDQRIHPIPFVLLKPLKMRAKIGNTCLAQAKIRLHLYASGYLATHLVIRLNPDLIKDLTSLRRTLYETRPWGRKGNWTWHSRLGTHTLREALEQVDSFVQDSLFDSGLRNKWDEEWVSSIKVRTNIKRDERGYWLDDEIDTSTELATSWLDLTGDQLGKPFVYDPFKDDGAVSITYTTRKGVFFSGIEFSNNDLECYRGKCARRDLRSFWSILMMRELVLLKKQVYADLNVYFKEELVRLKKIRLSNQSRLLQQPIFEFSVFDEDIGAYLFGLDQVIKSALPWKRALYSLLSDSVGLDALRERNRELMKDWEDEVGKYDPLVAYLWKKVLLPIRMMFNV